ncbi:hybrid sensor histidine kinase/response regulator [Variovorax sp. MHTC-1]|uniref:hybrid sensor histidine kinase/response regulator n=1 Tax=Variovorax sp. MHTC-1 TaxID=2495593 RepID=UPI000F881BB2|nr:hybrid sensor histidine kinase/response regulator [Variovorax sp. MHTC-1]RST50356.1 hybrid sensor histidine kinase/response regulator [Variovorax sp. MHTC-1]
MTAPIRVLHLEDDPADAERIRAGLQAEGLACDIAWVQTREDFIAALQRQAFDLVLCDYEVGGMALLRQVLQQHPGTLLIVVTAELLPEEEGVECLEAGATDYVIKRRLRRLGYSVRRAIAERQHMAALRQVEDDLRALNADLEAHVHLRTAELETANAFLNSVIQHIPYQVLVKNADDLKLVRVNRSVEKLLGRTEQELLGKTARDFVSSKEEADFFTAKDKEALALGREVDIPEETLHTRDGSVRVLHAKKIPILDEAGQPRWLLTMSEDVTERKKKEREIERLNAALAQRSAEVEAANRAKSTFLATMSHEIRTPMNGMLGMLELLSLTELDAEQRETLGLVRESSRSLLRIIDDILDFSKIEAGKLEVRPEVVSIKRLIEEVQSIYLGNASSKGLVVRRMVDPRISPALRVDPVRLRQILNNFVSNAIKFTSEGWIDINVQWLGRADGQESLRFEVKDTGIGISPEDQKRLFQPFSQADGDEARRRPGGTGLGLVISRQLAQMMGGSISLDSARGKGTTMTLELSLPVAESPPGSDADSARPLPAATAMRRMAPGTAQAETEGTLVLLVDDHPVNRMLLLRQVRTLGYAAQTADDGVQALELWKSGRFGLVITDCHMPRMDGYELARSIRALESDAGRERVPIVACTANALQGEAEACLAAGMDDFLVKPVELAQLTEKLDRWLPLPQVPSQSAASAGSIPEAAPSVSPIDQALLTATCGGDASMVGEVLAAFRRTCEDDSAGLGQAVAAGDLAQVTQFAHRMAGAGKMVGAAAFAAACENIERASRIGDWKAVLAGMPAFEQERMRLAAYLEGRKGTRTRTQPGS